MMATDPRAPKTNVVRTSLFQTGDFKLACGVNSTWKIECDALTRDDWAGLAAMLMDYLPSGFYEVVGVPRGGVPFANALKPYRSVMADRLLVVDDVWTTGESMRRYIKAHLSHVDPDRLMSAVAFARNRVRPEVTALFTMPFRSEVTYEVELGDYR